MAGQLDARKDPDLWKVRNISTRQLHALTGEGDAYRTLISKIQSIGCGAKQTSLSLQV